VRYVAGEAGGNAPSTPATLNTEEVARLTLEAAQGGLTSSINDPGLIYTFYILTQIALAARSDDWQNSLAKLGINLPADSTLFDLTTEMQNAIDDFLYDHNTASDISEMAQKAAGEALSILATPKSTTLFGSGLAEVKTAVRDLSTKKGFADLGQKFFGLFMARFLNFYLSRITASHVNSNTLHHIGHISEFNESLRLHCEQSARIVRDFCGEWYSKTEYLQGINLENTSGFIAVAIKKLRAEIKQQEIGL
jgi:hypothetical protein